MAVDASALRLSDYLLISNSPLVQRVGWSLLQNGSILDDLPLLTKKQLVMNGVRFQGDVLPAINWSKLNAEPAVVNAVPKPFQEQVYLIRNAIDTDKKLVEDETQIVDPRGIRLEAFLRSVAYEMNDKFINNDQIAGNADAFVGIKARLDDYATYGCESELKIDGGGVDMSQAGMTAATANTFIETVDNLLDYLGASNGGGVVLYMNDVLKRRFARAIRTLGAGAGFETVRDGFDRAIDTYKGAVVRDIGRKKDQSTRIIPTVESSAGAASGGTYTSIYGVRYGEDALVGWQFDDLESSVMDLGLLNNGVTYRTVIDWAIGLYQAHSRAIGRIYDIKLS